MEEKHKELQLVELHEFLTNQPVHAFAAVVFADFRFYCRAFSLLDVRVHLAMTQAGGRLRVARRLSAAHACNAHVCATTPRMLLGCRRNQRPLHPLHV